MRDDLRRVNYVTQIMKALLEPWDGWMKVTHAELQPV
jgi:hypothetical protein